MGFRLELLLPLLLGEGEVVYFFMRLSLMSRFIVVMELDSLLIAPS